MSLQITKDRVLKVIGDIETLAKERVLAGVPEANAPRKGEAVNNATLAYIHDNGSPLQEIPARPFMEPGILRVRDKIAAELKAAATDSLDGKEADMGKALHRAGLIAVSSIMQVIGEGGDPTTPLSLKTMQGRVKRLKKYQNMTSEGKADFMQQQIDAGMTPLNDTGQMRNAITYVVEK